MAQKALYPFYLIDLDEDDDTTGVEYNSVVDYPAHMRAFEMYGRNRQRSYFVDDEQQIITGVVIAEGTPIFRDDEQLGKHYVIFNQDAIRKLWLRFNRNNYVNRVNEQHNLNSIVQPGANGIYMIEQWIVDPDNGRGIPKALSRQGIRKGSWIASYKIEDRKLWRDMKAGKYNGFSIEGMFVKYGVDVKKTAEAHNTIERHNLAAKILKGLKK